MATLPEERATFLFASLLVGRQEHEPDDEPMLFEVVFDADGNPVIGELYVNEHDLDGVRATLTEAGLVYEEQPSEPEQLRILIDFGDLSIEQAVDAIRKLYAGKIHVGNPRYMFSVRVQQADNETAEVPISVQDLQPNLHLTFAISEASTVALGRLRWASFAQHIEASGLAESVKVHRDGLEVRLKSDAASVFFTSITELMNLFPG